LNLYLRGKAYEPVKKSKAQITVTCRCLQIVNAALQCQRAFYNLQMPLCNCKTPFKSFRRRFGIAQRRKFFAEKEMKLLRRVNLFFTPIAQGFGS
jgi:hypothetical protein